jgi:hypothetical protein
VLSAHTWDRVNSYKPPSGRQLEMKTSPSSGLLCSLDLTSAFCLLRWLFSFASWWK